MSKKSTLPDFQSDNSQADKQWTSAPRSQTSSRVLDEFRHKRGPLRALMFLVLLVIFGLIATLAVRNVNKEEVFGGILPGVETNGQTLSIGMLSQPQHLDPRTDPAAARLLVSTVYQGLTARDQKNRVTNTGLAKSWKVSSDGLHYTFTLRTAYFATGTPVTSQYVVKSFQALSEQKLGGDLLAHVSAITNTDAKTVKMDLSQPDPLLLTKLAGPLGIVYEASAGSSFDGNHLPAGSGPYSFSTRNGDTLRLSSNPQYKAARTSARPAFDAISVKYFPSSHELFESFKKGSLDGAIGLDAQDYQSATADKDLSSRLVTGPSTQRAVVAFNAADSSLTSDLRYRLIYRMVFNRDELLKVSGASGFVNASPLNSLELGYKDALKGQENDLEKAKQDVRYFVMYYGWTTFTMALSPDFPQAVADKMVEQTEAMGDHLKLVRLNAQQWHDEVTNAPEGKMKYDMAAFLDSGLYTFSKFTHDTWWHFDSVEADKTYEAASTANTQKEYEQQIDQAAQQLLANQPWTWLYQMNSVSLWKKGFTGMPTSMLDEWVDLSNVATTGSSSKE